MTEKQQQFLSKYISDNTIKYLDSKGFDTISSAIDFIIKTSTYIKYSKDYIVMFDILSIDCDNLKAEQNRTTFINNNKNKYSGPNDEYYSLDEIITIPGLNIKYFRYKQQWCKGMSSNITSYYITVDEDNNQVNYNIQYDSLFKSNITTLYEFFKYLQINSFNIDESDSQ